MRINFIIVIIIGILLFFTLAECGEILPPIPLKTESTIFHASDLQGGDFFGTSVSIDGNYAIVGAPYEDTNRNDAGAAYIYHYDGSSWNEEAILHASDASGDDYFGSCVDLNENFAVVSRGGIGKVRGVYIYHRNGNTWDEESILHPTDTTSDTTRYGAGIGISGNRVVVAWPEGAVCIYEYDGTHWQEQTTLHASNSQPDDNFGYSVAIDNNFVAVSAICSDVKANNGGAVYLFHYDGDKWGEESICYASDEQDFDYFGDSVKISGDYMIGTRTRYDTDDNAVYIYHRNGSNWGEEFVIKNISGIGTSRFGLPVDIDGDYVIIGAPYTSTTTDGCESVRSGVAYIYHRNASKWEAEFELYASDRDDGDTFGNAVGISDDNCIVGACMENGGQALVNKAGAAYIFK